MHAGAIPAVCKPLTTPTHYRAYLFLLTFYPVLHSSSFAPTPFKKPVDLNSALCPTVLCGVLPAHFCTIPYEFLPTYAHTAFLFYPASSLCLAPHYLADWCALCTCLTDRPSPLPQKAIFCRSAAFFIASQSVFTQKPTFGPWSAPFNAVTPYQNHHTFFILTNNLLKGGWGWGG